MNVYILRWNPAISSYKMDKHLEIVSYAKEERYPTHFDWSVREWEKLQPHDMFILLQVGTDNDGIAMVGRFVSEAYEDDSWRKDGKTIHYADLDIFDAFDLSKETKLRAENFEKDIFIKWHGGHSGELLKEDVASALIEKIKAANKDSKHWKGSSLEDFIEQPILVYDDEFEDFDEEVAIEFLTEKKEVILKDIAAYNPIIHTNGEEEYDYLADDEYDIEIINPVSKKSMFICMEYMELSISIDEWIEDYELTDEEFSEMRSKILKILNNENCIVVAKNKKSQIDAFLSEKPVDKDTSYNELVKQFDLYEEERPLVTKIQVIYWDSSKSFEVSKP